MNTFELRNSKTGRRFTDLHKYVILELPKVPKEDDGHPIWPQLQFLKCKAEEDMTLLAEQHPEVKPLVAEYKHFTLLEKFRLRARQREKDRRDAWAMREYIKDEGRAEVRAEMDTIRAEMEKVIIEKDREVAEQARVNAEQAQEIAELKRLLQYQKDRS